MGWVLVALSLIIILLDQVGYLSSSLISNRESNVPPMKLSKHIRGGGGSGGGGDYPGAAVTPFSLRLDATTTDSPVAIVSGGNATVRKQQHFTFFSRARPDRTGAALLDKLLCHALA